MIVKALSRTTRGVKPLVLPQKLPELRTLEYSETCIQAREVGGDYYDVLSLGRERLGLIIGDTSARASALLS